MKKGNVYRIWKSYVLKCQQTSGLEKKNVELEESLNQIMFLDSPISYLKLDDCDQKFFDLLIDQMDGNYLERLEIGKYHFLTVERVVKILSKFRKLKYLSIERYRRNLSDEDQTWLENYIKQCKISLTLNIWPRKVEEFI